MRWKTSQSRRYTIHTSGIAFVYIIRRSRQQSTKNIRFDSIFVAVKCQIYGDFTHRSLRTAHESIIYSSIYDVIYRCVCDGLIWGWTIFFFLCFCLNHRQYTTPIKYLFFRFIFAIGFKENCSLRFSILCASLFFTKRLMLPRHLVHLFMSGNVKINKHAWNKKQETRSGNRLFHENSPKRVKYATALCAAKLKSQIETYITYIFKT